MELERKISDTFVKSAHPREVDSPPLSGTQASTSFNICAHYWKDLGEQNECISFFRNGINLDEDTKRTIHNPQTEEWVVSYINFLWQAFERKAREERKEKDELLSKLGYAFYSLDDNHYRDFQKKEWILTAKRLVEASIHREPTENEVLDNCAKYKNFERYRLCYMLEFPDKAALSRISYPKMRNYADAFLTLAEMIDPEGKPFFDMITTNSCPLLRAVRNKNGSGSAIVRRDFG